MREYIDSRDVANTVMMLATAFDGTIAIVEGITDRRLYGKFFDREKVEVVIAHSKSNVRSAVRMAYSERRLVPVVGIIDADLDRLNGRGRNPPLFLTDTRDSEGMMLRSRAFDDILDEYGDPDRIASFEDSHGKIIDAVLDAAYPIGMLMYVSERNGLGYSFKDLDYELFIDRRTLRCDVRRLVEHVSSKSPQSRQMGVKDVIQLLSMEEERDEWDVCRGHDLMAILAIGLRYIFGGNNCRNITGNQLAGGFRLAYDREDIESTRLFRETTEWCSRKNIALWAVRS